ncbi:MAG TPA: hypothetical protein VMZ28_13540 [Kofleriaceae bacterium]|nr:hypothetical protein [Kofleriaceae bacterium]
MRVSPAAANRRGLTSAAALAALAALAGCTAHADPAPPPPRAQVRVRAFTEATPVVHIVAAPPFAFAATASGIDRWDLRSGQALHLGSADGLAGERVQAIDLDSSHAQLWIATEVGLTRYDLASSAFGPVPPPPEALGIESFEGATLAASDRGVWLGLARGLYHLSPEGVWSATGITAAVSDLLIDADGALWIGTAVGLFVERAGAWRALGPERGCDLAAVRFVALGPDGRAVAVGENGDGRQRVAVAEGEGCQSYRTSPDQPWRAAASRMDELLVLTDARLFSLRRPVPGGRALGRDGMQLLTVPRIDGERPPSSPYVLRAAAAQLPAGAQALAAFEDEVLVGTRNLGTARVAADRGGAVAWLRRGELVEAAHTLSVACVSRDDCYVATGGPRAWRFDGERFVPTGGGERRVLAVARSAAGRIVGLRQTPDGQRIAVAELRGDDWRELGFAIETPGGDPEVSFARFAPGGRLWVGLRYRDDAGALMPWGVAQIDLALGAVSYHGPEGDPAVPSDVSAVDFQGDEAWMATGQGAAQLAGRKLALFGADEGWGGGLLRGVACGGGAVYVAGEHGIGRYEAGRWVYPRALAQPVNDIERAPDGRLWMATERGLAVYDGARVRRLDARRGLVENHIRDIALDQYGRVWVRGAHSLGLVTP